MNRKPYRNPNPVGFTSGGTLRSSGLDPSSYDSEDSDGPEFREDRSDMDLSSDEELLTRVIDSDDAVFLTEELPLDRRRVKPGSGHFRASNRTRHQFSEPQPVISDPLSDPRTERMYGKGLAMLKNMGYKGGALGREGKGLIQPLDFSNLSNNEETAFYKVVPPEAVGASATDTRVGPNDWIADLDNYSQELQAKLGVIVRDRNRMVEASGQLRNESQSLRSQIELKTGSLEALKSQHSPFTQRFNTYSTHLKTLKLHLDLGPSSSNGQADSKESLNHQVRLVTNELVAISPALEPIDSFGRIYGSVVKLTFKVLFNTRFYHRLPEYDPFFNSLHSVQDGLRSLSMGGDHAVRMRKMLNYYLVNRLAAYFKDTWDPFNSDEGLSIYQYFHTHLSPFYTDKEYDSVYSGLKYYPKSLKTIALEEDGLSFLLNVIILKIARYTKEIESPKDLYNSHIIVFPWLQYLDDTRIQFLVDTFFEVFFARDESLIPGDSSCGGGYDPNKIEAYASVYKNWATLIKNDATFVTKLYDKLSSQLSALDLVAALRANKIEFTGLIKSVLQWSRLLGEDHTTKLFSNTILPPFTKFMVESISALPVAGNPGDRDPKSVNSPDALLNQEIESILDHYTGFKSALPGYLNGDKNIQDRCFRTILRNMENYVNSHV